ncbi:MAG TPA: RelA/SpoT family protein [Ktedonobacteraceae bacterium]|nr:RelA/SpoT family protein [Ktedonobacteraceae bacterium]
MVKKLLEQGFIPQKPPTELGRLLSLVRQYLAPPEVDRVVLASQLALETCLGVEGERPIPPLKHALAVTTILAQIHIDSVGIAAGLIFEAVDADLLPLERVEQVLGIVTSRVVGSMLRLNILERKKRNVSSSKNGHDERENAGSNGGAENKKPRIREALQRQQAETVRKMFVAMADDPRVVLLKLAYRLHAMRMMCQPDYQGDRQEMLTMARETREIYAPLAGRLGISRIESELEDLAFQILETDQYNWVRAIVELESKQWRSYVERICAVLRKEMALIGVKADVSGRVKHLYSFYKKLVRNAIAVDSSEALKAAADTGQIHDLTAFRILVDSTQDCYVALGHVHSLWKPKEGRIRDFIANPKLNGYRALHTTVFCQDDQLVEIQIRTHAMHEMAEYGVAMHWHYKDVGDSASGSARELLSWLRQLNEWQRDIRSSNASDTEFIEAIKDDIFQEQIFVFTPKGEVKDLPVGSTPLDFAYRIHSEVGDSCAGARIITQVQTGEDDRLVTRMVPLDYELKSGEIVDIVTNRTAHPTRDWLTFARTAAARSKIRRYLKIHERHINIQIGRERLDRELKGLGRAVEAVTEDAENWLCSEFHMDTFEDILSAIGADDIRPHAASVKLQEYWQLREGKEAKDSKESEEALVLPIATGKPTITARVEVAGVSGLLTKLANCCCPLPSDEIVGFISRGKGVVVHRADCRNLERTRNRERERLVAVSWVSMSHPRYQAPIIITARDRAGLIRDIATVVSDGGINLTAMSSYASGHHEPVLITATLEIEELDQLQRIFARIEKVKDVIHVERDLGKKK